MPEFVTIVLRDGLAKAFLGNAQTLVEDEALPQYISKRRWFGLKDQQIETASIVRITNIGDNATEILLAEIEVKTSGTKSLWLLPMGILWEDEPSAALPNRLALARVRRGRRLGLLTDAFSLPGFAHRLVACLAAGEQFGQEDSIVKFRPTDAGQKALVAFADAEINWLAAEQSNSSLTISDVAMVKIYRRISPGIHPEAEMGRYLTEQGFTHAPPLLGDVVRVAADGTPSTLAIALGFVRHQGDAWSWIFDHLTRAIDQFTTTEFGKAEKADLLADCEAIIAVIGRRLGEMHAVLSRETADDAFAPENRSAVRCRTMGSENRGADCQSGRYCLPKQ